MWVLLGTVFIASLLGSLHCVGMCGPFAILASASSEKRASAVAPATAYSLGRLLTYALVGLTFGSVGLALNHSVASLGNLQLQSVQRVATYFAGGMMIIIGVVALLQQFGWRLRLPSFGGPIQSMLTRIYRWVKDQPRIRRAFFIGAVSCLMPCGWLYTFAMVAAGTGDPWYGTLLMISFWAGTVPIMATLMLGAGRLSPSLERALPFVMAFTLIIVGGLTISFRAPIALDQIPELAESKNVVEQVEQLDHTQLPCCSGK
ncbi:MAG: sulfite exporter TauE/SafE family protein [Planctomycetota bacterium]